MICPKCQAEYVAGFTQCSDCLVPLVDGLRRPAGGSQADPGVGAGPLPDPVCVFRGSDPGHIALAQSLLRSAAIPFCTLNEMVNQITGSLFAGFAPVEIHVSACDADDARLVLAEVVHRG
jgi:Putative prokaryotic signal transducing protein